MIGARAALNVRALQRKADVSPQATEVREQLWLGGVPESPGDPGVFKMLESVVHLRAGRRGELADRRLIYPSLRDLQAGAPVRALVPPRRAARSL